MCVTPAPPVPSPRPSPFGRGVERACLARRGEPLEHRHSQRPSADRAARDPLSRRERGRGEGTGASDKGSLNSSRIRLRTESRSLQTSALVKRTTRTPKFRSPRCGRCRSRQTSRAACRPPDRSSSRRVSPRDNRSRPRSDRTGLAPELPAVKTRAAQAPPKDVFGWRRMLAKGARKFVRVRKSCASCRRGRSPHPCPSPFGRGLSAPAVAHRGEPLEHRHSQRPSAGRAARDPASPVGRGQG